MSRLIADLAARSLLCFGIAAAVAGFLRDPGPPPTTPSCADTYAQFGAVDRDGGFTATDVIPLVPGQEFGWRVAVDDTFAHTWREVLITPAAPREWIGSDLVITNDGTVGITERSEVAVNGLLEHAWTITEGDPAGAHELLLYVDGRLVNTFHFVVR